MEKRRIRREKSMGKMHKLPTSLGKNDMVLWVGQDNVAS